MTSFIGSRIAIGRTAAASACRRVASKPRIVYELSTSRNHLGTEYSVSAFALLKLRLKASLYRRQQSIFHRPHPQY